MSQKANIQYRSALAGTLNTATYTAIGPAFTVPGKLVVITSTLGANVLISWNGVNDHMLLENGATTIAESVRTLDFGSMGMEAPGGQLFAKLATATAAGSVSATYFG